MGVNDLMKNMVALAYDDYVNGRILLKQSEYEEVKGNIRLIAVRGKPFRNYGKHQKTALNNKIEYYRTAKLFLEGTRLGDYLIRKAEEEVLSGKPRRTTRKSGEL